MSVSHGRYLPLASGITGTKIFDIMEFIIMLAVGILRFLLTVIRVRCTQIKIKPNVVNRSKLLTHLMSHKCYRLKRLISRYFTSLKVCKKVVFL